MPVPLPTAPRPRRYWLLPLLLLLLSGPLAAQPSRRRYWEADTDSLRQVLNTQHADTARLRTLLHLYDVHIMFAPASEPLFQELVQLALRLRHPDAAAVRLSYAAQQQLAKKEPARALDSMRAAVAMFDRSGRPIPHVLARWGCFSGSSSRQRRK